MINITFQKSTSPNYPTAVKRAKQNASLYKEEGEGRGLTHHSEYLLDKVHLAIKLFEIVGDWKSSELYINGTLSNNANADLNTLKFIQDCGKERNKALIKDDYCLGLDEYSDGSHHFICHRLNTVLFKRELTSYWGYSRHSKNVWYQNGTINLERKIFYVDKERIEKLLLAEAEQKKLNFCPYFSEAALKNMILELPDQVDLNNHSEYVLDEDSIEPLVYSVQEFEELKKRNYMSVTINPKQEEEEKKDRFKIDNTDVSYEDIGGLEKEIRLVRECVEVPYKYPEIFERLGISPYKGILFYGPPGTGKTQLAKAVANECNMNFYVINGPEIFDKWFGESEKKLRELFETAKENEPSVIFIDEIDSIGSKREDDASKTHYNKIVTQLLTLMDGMNSREKVVVMAATNRPNSLDPALRRPGRFDFEIYIAPPDEKGREEILRIHTRKMPLSSDVDLPFLAQSLYGYVGADIAGLCKEAALCALRRNIKSIDHYGGDIAQNIYVTMDDFKQAKNKIIPSAGREVMSYHSDVKWEDVIGVDDVKLELEKKVIRPWENKEKYKGLKIIKGILFYGPPGVGKTYLSRALGSKLGMNVISLKGSDILSKYHGDSPVKLRSFFDKARELAPCMIVIDEIDAIASSREFQRSGSDLVNELLSQMDGYDELTDVLVIGTTNLLNSIDPAILRPGRFDLKIEIPYPDYRGVEYLFKYYLGKTPMNNGVNLSALNLESVKTGADIANIVNQAILEAIWEGSDSISTEHIEKYIRESE